MAHQDLDRLDDDELIVRCLDSMPNVVQKESEGYDFSRHTDGQKWLYLIYDYEWQVATGGFRGLFLNRGEGQADVLQALNAVGAHEDRALLERAITVRDNTEALRELSREFNETSDPRTPLAAYMRAHPGKFFRDANA